MCKLIMHVPAGVCFQTQQLEEKALRSLMVYNEDVASQQLILPHPKKKGIPISIPIRIMSFICPASASSFIVSGAGLQTQILFQLYVLLQGCSLPGTCGRTRNMIRTSGAQGFFYPEDRNFLNPQHYRLKSWSHSRLEDARSLKE